MNLAGLAKRAKFVANLIGCGFHLRKSSDCNRFQRYSFISWIMASGMSTNSGGKSSSQEQPKHRNRLANEKSSYLLQHASNPVDWFAWGEEAFQKARKENKVIFLSVGYSTCHWCHVMERESFENEEIAKIMNKNFINIKVDREERPDVDKVYMTFVQATTGSGGWPMSVWLTPELKPIYGGTYYPPDDRYFGHPGFMTIMKRISEQWEKNRDKICSQGAQMLDVIRQNILPVQSDSCPNEESIQKCFQQYVHRYDTRFGGFDKAPKFPQPVNFNFLLRIHARNPNSEEGKIALKMATHTMIEMAKGGIHDHICQGFHRYSTDREWHVPHFEKMLYDQGQLAVSYLEAFQITKDKIFSDVARDILNYVSRDLCNKHGGFYSAEDADSLPSHDATHKREGAFCVWTHDEIKQYLGRSLNENCNVTLADLFCKYYNVLPQGNVDPYKDPHNELKGKNVLIIKSSEEEIAKSFNVTEKVVKKALDQSKEILYEIRQKRPKPHLDDKFLASWNGLMISGYARAGQILSEQHYTDKAIKAAKFLYDHLYNSSTNCLLRSAYKNDSDDIVQIANPVPGVLEDYTFVIRSLLDLYEACYDPWCLEWAEQLQNMQDNLFWDSENGAYFYSVSTDPSIVLRLKEDQDGAEPTSNSVSITNLMRLFNYLDNPEYQKKALKILTVFGSRLKEFPLILPEMICGLMFLRSTKKIIVVGARDDKVTQEMLNCIHEHFLPFKTLIFADGNEDNILYKRIGILKHLQATSGGRPTAYVCEGDNCSLPVTNVAELEKML